MSEEIKQQLKEFIEWCSRKDDVFYAFDNTDKAIDEFIKSKTNNDEETI